MLVDREHTRRQGFTFLELAVGAVATGGVRDGCAKEVDVPAVQEISVVRIAEGITKVMSVVQES